MLKLTIRSLVFAAALFSGASALAQHATLYTWYSPSRGDHFTTTDPRWAAEIGHLRSPDYTLVRIEGSVLSPDYPQPPDTTPIYSFWNPARGDNFLSSNPAWTSREEQDGYRRFRLEGYVYNAPKAGTRPLVSLWSPSRADNYSTTDPRVAVRLNASAGNPSGTMAGGAYNTYRIEGYVLPPPSTADIRQPAHVDNLEKIGFGAWRPLMPFERGVRPEDPIARANAQFQGKMVIVPVQFADVRFGTGDFARFGRFASRTDDLSLERGLSAVSRGKFSWRATLTPVVQDPMTFDQIIKSGDATKAINNTTETLDDGTVINWSREEFQRRHGFSVDVFDLDGDGVKDDELNGRTRVLKLADRFIRYNTFDTNNDGRVDSSELVVLRFGADPGIGGQMGWSGTHRGDGKSVAVPVGMVAKDTTRAGLMHELLHVWGGTDIYGPGFALNFGNTIMAAMSGDDRAFDLDPWHLQKFGWVRPRFIPIGPTAGLAGGSEVMLAAGHDGSGQEAGRPIIFYDPARGLREYFVVQYRSQFPRCPGSGFITNLCPNYKDNGAPDTGFAVWHVVTKADGGLQDIRKVNDTGERIAWPAGTADDGHMFRLGVINPDDGKIGGTNYLAASNEQVALRWWNGQDSRIRLSAGLVSQTSPVAVLQWRDVGRSFAPRLDILRVAGFPAEEYPNVNAGQTIAVDGVFGASGAGFGARLIAEADGSARTARVASWSPTRLTIEVPRDAPAGRYQLKVGAESASLTSGWLSNGIKLQIPMRPMAQIDLPRDFDRRISALELRVTPVEGVELDLSERALPDVPPPPAAPIDPHGYRLDSRVELRPELREQIQNPELREQVLRTQRQFQLQQAPTKKSAPDEKEDEKDQPQQSGKKKDQGGLN